MALSTFPFLSVKRVWLVLLDGGKVLFSGSQVLSVVSVVGVLELSEKNQSHRLCSGVWP